MEQERQIKETEARCRSLEQQLTQEQTARQALEQEKGQTSGSGGGSPAAAAEAEAYAQFRDRVGDIECEAHKRAAELEGIPLWRNEAGF